MADDAWYKSFVPGPRGREQRKTSMLEPSFTAQADLEDVDAGILFTRPDLPLNGPPKASRLPRASSYTDFHRRRKNDDIRDKKLKVELRNDEEFHEWFDGLSDKLVESSHARYRTYLEQLRLSRNHVDSLLDGSSATLQLLTALSTSFRAVELQTSTFQSRCEGVLAEQRRLGTMADEISQNLQYYSLLEPINRRLNAPGAGHFVRGDDFAQMLSNMDQCLEYMKNHSHQKEASAYESRYRLLMTRALTLIRVHFTNTLRDIASDVSKRIAERQLTDTTTSALLYAKFRVGAAELKKLGLEIHRRALPPADAEPGTEGEYQSLMNELYQSYSAARGRLLVPLVRKRLADLAAAPNTSKDLVAFARATISYIRGLCMDEFELWHEWFEGEGGLYEFLEAMCEPLFDYLRPRTIYENQLPKLCEVCSIIQVRYMEDQEDDDYSQERNRLEFSHLIRPALEDAQTRLVFLTLAVLRDSIEKFKPTQADLDCARRSKGPVTQGSRTKAPVLSGRKASSNGNHAAMLKTPTVVEEEDGNDTLDLQWRYGSGASYQEWYPTLRKAIWLLSKIYRLVNSTVFDDLAHQIVHQTTLSLAAAAAQVATKTSIIDSRLFLLKQLLILKQQVIAFDIEFVTPEVQFDFSNLTNTFWELRERGGLFDPRNLLRLVGGGLMPRVIENMLDAKAELDGRLRTVINEFTDSYADRMTHPVSVAASGKKGFVGAAAVQEVRANIEKEVPLLRAKLSEYLDNVRVKETLVGAVQDQALQHYEDFFDRITAQSNGNVVSKKGKSREDDIWDPNTFADWSNTVFGVDRMPGMEYLDEEDDSGFSPSLSRSGSMLTERE